MKTQACANFWKCKTMLKPEDPRVQVGRFIYCEACGAEKK